MLANVGVLVSAGLVFWLNAAWPDWLVGGLIAVIVIYSALNIVQEASKANPEAQEPKGEYL